MTAYIKEINCEFCGETLIARSAKAKFHPIHTTTCYICKKSIEKPTGVIIKNPTITCSKKCSIEKQKKTSLERYGVEFPLQSKEIHQKTIESLKEHLQDEEFKTNLKNKISKTNLERYGVENVFQKESKIRKAFEKENLEKYGVVNPGGLKETLDKINQTNLERYGVAWSGQLEHIREINSKRLSKKSTQDNMTQGVIDKFGKDNVFKVTEIQEKIKKTNLEKYGVENPAQTEEIKNKMKETMLKNHGTIHTAQLKILNLKDWLNFKDFLNQNPERNIFKLANYFNLKPATIKSKIIQENLIDYFEDFYKFSDPEYIIKEFLSEFPIKVTYHNRKIIPPLELDFYIPEFKLAIEVSPTWTHKFDLEHGIKDKEYHYKKFKLCQEKGIELITIFDWYNQDLILDLIKNKINKSEFIEQETLTTKITRNLENYHENFLKEHSVAKNILNYKNTVIAELYSNEILVGLGVFYKMSQNTFELKRVCFKDYYNNSNNLKLLIEAVLADSDNLVSILAYSDNGFQTGDDFKNIGFSLVEETKGNLYWSHRKKEIHFKDEDFSKENREIFTDLLTIYDCGYRKWILNKK